MAIDDEPRILPAGDGALVVEFGHAIDPEINARVLALDAALVAALAGAIETVPTYRSLLVQYDPLALPAADLIARIRALAATPPPALPRGRRVTLPVAFGGGFGSDFGELAGRLGLDAEGILRLLTGAEFRVYMIGFAPGFAYLGGLPECLHIPRRASPRAKVPAGSVGIGGVQAAVFSVESPSGWHLLGRTPLRPFDLRRADPFLFRAGDRVRFRAIDAEEFARLDRLAAADDNLARIETP